MKKLIKRILREEINKSVKYYRFLDKLSSIIEPPYFRNMYEKYNGGFWDITDEDDQEYILKNIYGDDINIKDRSIYNDEGNTIYHERSNGRWNKIEYDDNGNITYVEDSNGVWNKWDYDDNGNEIYSEDSRGHWKKTEWDDNGYVKYIEGFNGFPHWAKMEYDDNGNKLYHEDSFGLSFRNDPKIFNR